MHNFKMPDLKPHVLSDLCPFCGTEKIRVICSKLPYRHRKCSICGRSWKTLEINCLPESFDRNILSILISKGIVQLRDVLPLLFTEKNE